ncbi:carbohydrate ABC transporter permease [Anoxynatronum buryatiense]|uniref:Carbohydrate ABC transporter membrane protein 2, CUT1 family n=1 Tax=Anoxynatronum buryatiense TaxID=489973 RepID=A0AA46AHI9_9CLOT|nr:carbohydrate ABC transporter permease [Anoxynatronum buryatiense]SMP40223.1 carbohydrate ABC transporter membrane protein 2, CUT1 family [Anoxynatronum buryatiense]
MQSHILKTWFFHLTRHFIMGSISFIFLFPLLWMVLGGFKTNNEIWQQPYRLLPGNWHFTDVFNTARGIQFGPYIFNSLLVGIVGSAATILCAALFAYALVFVKGRFHHRLFWLVLVTYMLPSAVTYVPSYVLLARMNLLDSLTGLMFSNLASVFAVFFLRQSFLKMNYEYIEAAQMDGASHLAILRHVVYPMNKPAFITVGLLTFVQNYSSYMWPSIILSSREKLLVSQGLRQFFIQEGAYGMNWSEVMLGSTLTVIPILVIFALGQRWFTTGITEDSGLK